MLAIIAVCLSAVSLVLHVVAPLTKTKVDDKARDAVDFAKDKVLPIAGSVLGDKTKAQATQAPTVGFGANVARDHRTK